MSNAAWFAAPLVLVLAATAMAQEGSLFRTDEPVVVRSTPLTLENGSFMYRELPPSARPKQLEVHDIVTVIVNYQMRMTSEADAQSRKTSNLSMVLTDWLRFDGKSVKPAPQSDGDPTVAGTNNSQYRAQSDLEGQDTLSFKLACEVIDILPNGSLVVEGHSDIGINEEQWRVSLSGIVRRESIMPDRTVTDDALLDRRIRVTSNGQVRDGYARGWAGRFWDKYKPF